MVGKEGAGPASRTSARLLGQNIATIKKATRCFVTASVTAPCQSSVVSRRSRQLSFDLRSPARWGGRRDGAGRKPAAARRDPHQRRTPLSRALPCHVTLTVRRGLPSLRTIGFVREFERSVRRACDRGRFRITHYSIQSDHVHAIVETSSTRDLACGMKSLGSRLARAANRVFRHRGPVLADRFHLHVLRTPREVRNAIGYVLLNARHHLAQLRRRLDPRGRIDPASSGRWFDGWRECLPAPRDPPAVAKPRTWLLRSGWRTAGLLSMMDVPGSGASASRKRDRPPVPCVASLQRV